MRICISILVLIASLTLSAQTSDYNRKDIKKLLREREAEQARFASENEQVHSFLPAPGFSVPVGQPTINVLQIPGGKRSQAGFAWNMMDTSPEGLTTGPASINLTTGDVNIIQTVDADNLWMSAADMVNDTWYGASFNNGLSQLYTIDQETGDYELIGSIGKNVTGMAYDINTETMYASVIVGQNTELHSINLSNASTQLIGQSCPECIFIGLAANADGDLYAIDIFSNQLFSVNTATGAAQPIGSLGVDINFAQDIAFDRDNNQLYGTLFASAGFGGLYNINTATGFATIINIFNGELAGFAIPYTWVEPGAPGQVSNFEAQTTAPGSLDVALSWTNPASTVSGDALEELSSVLVKRNGTTIHSINNPVIGGEESYTDVDIIDDGLYVYTVLGHNQEGDGWPVSKSVFAGIDVPGPPQNVDLKPGSLGYLTWSPPAEGLSGGFFDEESLSYAILRQPDGVLVAENLADTMYLDTNIPNIGNYFYEVTAFSIHGQGGTAVSNMAVLGADDVLFAEDFSGLEPLVELPEGWTIEGSPFRWVVTDDNQAGGSPPELRLHWFPIITGFGRLVTHNIDIQGKEHLKFTKKQWFFNFVYYEGEVAGMDVMYDDDGEWHTVWQEDILADIPKGTYEYYFTVPQGTQNIRLGFRFEGNTYNIMRWMMDDMILQPVPDNDLVALGINGNTAPLQGVTYEYHVDITNAGLITQEDYTVKLMREGGIEVAQLPGEPIAWGDSLTYVFEYTPGPGDEGNTYLYGYIDFANDLYPDNNQTNELPVSIQNENITNVTIGTDQTFPPHRIPFDFHFKNNLSQTLYFPDELGVESGIITGLMLYNSFIQDLSGKPLRVWIGETDSSDLSQGWVDPSTLTQVFYGGVPLPRGENTVFIPFNKAFVYTGQNLVIYTNKQYDVFTYSNLNRFYATLDENSSRTRRVSSDLDDPLNPFNPPTGSVSHWLPNTTIYMQTTGTGALECTITDGTNPVAGVAISFAEIAVNVQSDANGHFSLPVLPPGSYTMHLTSPGFYDKTVEDVLITEGQTTNIQVEMELLPSVSISGFVGGSDFPEEGLAGAAVLLTGFNDFNTETDANGMYLIDNIIPGFEYTLHVSKPGFQWHSQQLFIDADGLVVDDIILNEIPRPVTNVEVEEVASGALVTWQEPGSGVEFRYDDGVVHSSFGFGVGTLNSVIGAVHNRNATLEEITWQLTDEGGPHHTVKIWVLGLNPAGHPDKDNIIYTAENVPNTDNVWSSYELAEPLELPNGFFIGISYAGNLGLATDDGVGEPYPFIPGTHFATLNISNPAASFSPIEDWGFSNNFLLRGIGFDHGPARGRALESFDIYRLPADQQDNQNQWTLLNSGHTDWEYLDHDWHNQASGIYRFAILANYTHGLISPPAFSSPVANDMEQQISINITTNSGNPPTGAAVTLAMQGGDQNHVYNATAAEDGIVVFPEVWFGTYNLTVSLANYETYTQSNIVVDESGPVNLDVELVEIIETPYNLLVDTEGYDPGRALFSWNNILPFFEGFEGTFPPAGWIKRNPDGGTGWEQIEAGTSPIPGWAGGLASPAPDGGNHMAFVTFIHGGENHNDQWLITPRFYAGDNQELSFNLRYWPNIYADNLEIRLSTTINTDVDAFDIVVDELNFGEDDHDEWRHYTYNLNEFVPSHTPVYAAFRERVANNTTMGAVLFLDNVSYGQVKNNSEQAKATMASLEEEHDATQAENTTKQADNVLGYDVFLNGALYASQVNDTELLFTNLPGGTHTAGVRAVYASGNSAIVSIDFSVEAGLLDATFLVDLSKAISSGLLESFDPGQHHVFMSGSMFDWAAPGTDTPEQMMEVFTSSPLQYRKVLSLPAGVYQYKYYSDLIGEGLNGAEWEGEPYRTFELIDEDIVIFEDFGPETLSVDDVSEGLVKVFPNPAREMIHIQSHEKITRVAVTDLTGRTIITDTPGALQSRLNVSGMNPGMYILEITTANGRDIRRIVVSNEH